MNLEQVYDTLRDIAGHSSKLDKEFLVKEHLADETFAKVCYYAYHPFYHYGVVPSLDQATSAQQIKGNALTPTAEAFFFLLDQLRTRELTGSAAKTAVALMLSTWEIPYADLLIHILRKDLRAGFTEGTLNRAKKGFVPVFDCMLAHKYEEKRIKSWPVAVQPKLDGVRCLVKATPDGIQFFSRTGKEEFATFPLIKRDLKQSLNWDNFADHVLWFDGELTSGNFNKTVGDVRRKSTSISDVYLTVFEVLTEEEFMNGSTVDHRERRMRLTQVLSSPVEWVKVIEEKLAKSNEEIMALYNDVRAAGGEGVIVKPLDGKYEPKRSHAWLKIKDQQTLDLMCTGVFEGEGKYANSLGGIIVKHKDTEVRVGSGFSDQQRADYWGKTASIVGGLVEIEFHEITPDNSLRHPRFNCVRFDKVHADA